LYSIKFKFTYIVLVLTLFFQTSCGASFGEKYERGNLEIFYTDEMKTYVEPLANYYEENNLIFDHKQSILLTSTTLGEDGGKFILKMVAEKDKEIPLKKLNDNINSLEKHLIKEVFSGANLEIQICDENFVALKK
jgi:hypothetical protein